MQNSPPLDELFQRFLDNQCSPEEFDYLIQMLASRSELDIRSFLITQELSKDNQFTAGKHDELYNALDEALARVIERTGTDQPASTTKIRRLKLWTSVAAAVLLLVVGSVTIFNFRRTSVSTAKVITSAPSHPVAKSLSGVTISLSDGSTVLFDSVERGFRLPQGTADLIKGDSGQLIYASAKSSNKFPVYNTVSTARGRQFRLTLQDGTKVWLNAGSSITFPTAFTGRERNVQISGEVYLEVAKNKEMPFHVRANDITITVLGTHFNVRAYSDEKEIKTTLLEGSVKVNRKSSNVILRPGQEARALNVSDQKISVRPADVESVTAWTNGYFRFDNADIYQVMGEIARWYDVEVKFEGEVRSHEFVGQIARSSKLSEVLKILEMEKVHIARRGNKLIVRP